jgi:hypothetical protein
MLVWFVIKVMAILVVLETIMHIQIFNVIWILEGLLTSCVFIFFSCVISLESNFFQLFLQLKSLVSNFGLSQVLTIVYCNNLIIIYLAKNRIFNKKTNIGVRSHCILDIISHSDILMKKIAMTENSVNILMKFKHCFVLYNI